MTFDTTQHSSSFDDSYAFHVHGVSSADDQLVLSSSAELESLREQASHLERLLQVMPAGVIVLDGKGVVKRANDQARDLLGEPLQGQIWRHIITRSFKPRADDGHEVSLIDGRRVKLSITPLVNEPGQLIVITDLTETRQLQARVGHMQRLSSLGKMVASLAHQIRTPLSAAMLYAANLKHKGLSAEAKDQFADKLQLRLKELESQVNDMLLFAKSGEDQVVNTMTLQELFESVSSTATTLVENASQRITFNGFEQPIHLLGNITALQGAILNLIENASQVSDQDALITVTAQHRNDSIVIKVQDQGPGIAKSIINKITQPFFTTKTNGTGLGLAVVKSVANSHHGELTVESTPNQGATFNLSLPIQRPEQANTTTVGAA